MFYFQVIQESENEYTFLPVASFWVVRVFNMILSNFILEFESNRNMWHVPSYLPNKITEMYVILYDTLQKEKNHLWSEYLHFLVFFLWKKPVTTINSRYLDHFDRFIDIEAKVSVF